MNKLPDKKIVGVSWKDITIEAIAALSKGNAGVLIPSEALYRWIEGTEYLTEWGRSPDPEWNPDYPSYRASLQKAWQDMVRDGRLVREQTGVYRLPSNIQQSDLPIWDEMVKTDEQLKVPTVKQTKISRIGRSQRLRDLLVNYYNARCQICGEDSLYLIPTEIPGRFHVEVHHVDGLAETYAVQQSGLLVGFKVNGLGNLTVLCPHHHAMMHHYYPYLIFDRKNLCWDNNKGTVLRLLTVTDNHRIRLQQG